MSEITNFSDVTMYNVRTLALREWYGMGINEGGEIVRV
jgi:hypothetical protein